MHAQPPLARATGPTPRQAAPLAGWEPSGPNDRVEKRVLLGVDALGGQSTGLHLRQPRLPTPQVQRAIGAMEQAPPNILGRVVVPVDEGRTAPSNGGVAPPYPPHHRAALAAAADVAQPRLSLVQEVRRAVLVHKHNPEVPLHLVLQREVGAGCWPGTENGNLPAPYATTICRDRATSSPTAARATRSSWAMYLSYTAWVRPCTLIRECRQRLSDTLGHICPWHAASMSTKSSKASSSPSSSGSGTP
jgi:hypothetical protein